MGLRTRLRNKLKAIADRFSGEFSAAAPQDRQGGSQDPAPGPAAAAPDVAVVHARLKRPRDERQD